MHNEAITAHLSTAQRAAVLTQALPYIQKYHDKIIVIKYGGNAMLNEELKQAVMGDIVLLSLIGIKIVLVHGGGPEITDMLSRVGKQTEFVDGLRVTDAETAEIVQMVLAGKVNKGLVQLIQQIGGKAIGLSGIDGYMLQAQTIDQRLGFAGEITAINVAPILDVLDKGYIPVVATVGCDKDGHTYNINADTAAAKIAVALQAESLLTLTDISGILHDPSDESSLISRICIHQADALIADGTITGGMIPKVESCIETVRAGVRKVFVIDGRVPHSILIELMTDEGIGTMFTGGATL